MLATLGITFVYIPSFVSTGKVSSCSNFEIIKTYAAIAFPMPSSLLYSVLKFRSGVLESLRGEDHFKRLRDAPDSVTTLLGGAIWGAAFTGLFCWVFVGGMFYFHGVL